MENLPNAPQMESRTEMAGPTQYRMFRDLGSEYSPWRDVQGQWCDSPLEAQKSYEAALCAKLNRKAA